MSRIFSLVFDCKWTDQCVCPDKHSTSRDTDLRWAIWSRSLSDKLPVKTVVEIWQTSRERTYLCVYFSLYLGCLQISFVSFLHNLVRIEDPQDGEASPFFFLFQIPYPIRGLSPFVPSSRIIPLSPRFALVLPSSSGFIGSHEFSISVQSSPLTLSRSSSQLV